MQSGAVRIAIWSAVCESRVRRSVGHGRRREERQMMRKQVRGVWPVVVSAALAIGTCEVLSEYRNLNAVLAAETGTPTQAAPMSQSELRALVAPIALYPDKLVAIVLAAATFPDQVAIAD